MEAEAPREPEDDSPPRLRARLAVWCEGAGVILGVATVVCSMANVISAQQAVAMGLPAVLLIAVGLIAAATPDASTGRRVGFQIGLIVGSLVTVWRFLFRHRGKGH
jgi:hypothetical protein